MNFEAALASIKAAIDVTRVLRDRRSNLEEVETQAKLVELMSQLVDAQLAIQEHRLERQQLEAEIGRLSAALETKGSVERRRDALVTVDDDGRWAAGPFCIACWETSHRLLSLTEGSGGGLVCPTCEHGVRMHATHWRDD